MVVPGATSSESLNFSSRPSPILVYLNDFVNNIESPINLFVDDTSLNMVVNSPDESASQLQSYIKKVSTLAKKWLVTFNPSKMMITRKVKKPFHSSLLVKYSN